MGGMLPAMLAPLAHFYLALNFLLVFAGMIIHHLADFATEPY